MTSERVGHPSLPFRSLPLLSLIYLGSSLLTSILILSYQSETQEQGTQTSLSFETSSSIREEFMALFLEEQEEEERARLEEEKKDWDNRERGEDDGGDDSGMSHRRGVGEMDWEELKEVCHKVGRGWIDRKNGPELIGQNRSYDPFYLHLMDRCRSIHLTS